jgi:predicted phosphate transport protein (TIGR00153 family)
MARTQDKLFWDAFSGHAGCTTKAAKLLVEICEHPDRAATLGQKIADLEHAGDTITHDVVHALHQTWITPLDREEIHGLISRLDDVLDFIDSASDRLALYEITETRPEAIDLAKLLAKSCESIERAMGMLQNLKEPRELLEICKQLNRDEHDADQIFRRGLARLFNAKEQNNPLEVMKWRDILEAIETATDRCEDVANIIEGIVLEHA